MLDLLEDFYQASEESSRAGVQGRLAFKPPLFTVAPGLPTDPGMGMPWSMRIINSRRLRTVGDYRSLSPEEVLDFPVLDGLLCAVSATDLIRCSTLILRNKWTRGGWEDPLEDQEDTGPDADPWGAYGLFDDDELVDCFRGD
jgi:hypothetical protein